MGKKENPDILFSNEFDFLDKEDNEDKEFSRLTNAAASISSEKQRRAETEPLQSAVNDVSNFSAEATTPAGTVGVDEEHELG